MSPGSHLNHRICGQFDFFGFNLIVLSITCLLTIIYCSLCLIKMQKLTFPTLPLSGQLLWDDWGSVLVHAEFDIPEQVNLLPRFIFVIEIMTPTSQILIDHGLFKKWVAVTFWFWNGIYITSLWGGSYRTSAAPFSFGLTDWSFLHVVFVSEGVYHEERIGHFSIKIKMLFSGGCPPSLKKGKL